MRSSQPSQSRSLTCPGLLDVHDSRAAYEEHGLFQVTMHPRLSGHRARVVALEKLITYIKQHRDVWFATHEQVARYVRH
jgi:peptidoglycan-N-acetylglucosamine deacetylase